MNFEFNRLFSSFECSHRLLLFLISFRVQSAAANLTVANVSFSSLVWKQNNCNNIHSLKLFMLFLFCMSFSALCLFLFLYFFLENIVIISFWFQWRIALLYCWLYYVKRCCSFALWPVPGLLFVSLDAFDFCFCFLFFFCLILFIISLCFFLYRVSIIRFMIYSSFCISVISLFDHSFNTKFVLFRRSVVVESYFFFFLFVLLLILLFISLWVLSMVPFFLFF